MFARFTMPGSGSLVDIAVAKVTKLESDAKNPSQTLIYTDDGLKTIVDCKLQHARHRLVSALDAREGTALTPNSK